MPPPKPKVGQPDEAIKWFRKLVPMTKDEWKQLDEQSQQRAFTLAGVAQLDLVADIQKEIERAIKKGESLESFKKRVSDKLENAWGEENPWRVDTIFRTNVQRAYQAGRRAELMDGDALATRPYLKFVAILDSRTSPVCSAANGTVLPATHTFWKTHWPPCHFACRSSVQSLTETGAENAGITKHAPRVKADEGFGGVDDEDWQPSLTDYPKELVKIYKRGQ